jgi:hypothetical protein
MTELSFPAGFQDFLIAAKRHCYAGSDDNTSVLRPLLAGSMQLDWSQGDWLYRDIYFGMEHFSGMEVVIHAGLPLWSMVYSGGVLAGAKDVRGLFAFLRTALRALPAKLPLRGPSRFEHGSAIYRMQVTGAIDRFNGQEDIQIDGRACYALSFSGGVIA